jgi:alpha-1,2-mannosyltransferase
VILLAVLAWIAALAAIWPLVRGYLTSVPDQRMVDLNVYRTSGLSVLQGQPLYTVLTPPPQLLPFTYPPAAALFAVPLALLPWSAAQLAWVPFVYVPLAVIIWFAFAPLLRRVSPVPLRAAAFAVIFAAGAYLFPMRDEMRFGQVDTVLLALAVADCAARSPRWPRGALVGLATAIKLVPGVFIVYLWLSGRRRAAVTAAVAAVAWTLGAWLLLPGDSVTYWTSTIFQSGRLGSNAGTSNQSLRGILLRIFLPGQAPGALWAAVAVLAAVAGFAVARRLARQDREMEGIAVTALDPPLPRRGGGHRRDPGGRPLPAADRHRGRHRGVLRADHPLVGPVPAEPARRAGAGRPGGGGRLRHRRRGAGGDPGPARVVPPGTGRARRGPARHRYLTLCDHYSSSRDTGCPELPLAVPALAVSSRARRGGARPRDRDRRAPARRPGGRRMRGADQRQHRLARDGGPPGAAGPCRRPL